MGTPWHVSQLVFGSASHSTWVTLFQPSSILREENINITLFARSSICHKADLVCVLLGLYCPLMCGFLGLDRLEHLELGPKSKLEVTTKHTNIYINIHRMKFTK